MNKKKFFDHLIEISQTQMSFNRRYDASRSYHANYDISPREKYDLQMDVKKVKSDISQLQDTAERLPDEFVDSICNKQLSYPLDRPIDEDKELTSWCDEVDDFLGQDLKSWGNNQKRY